MRLPRFPDDSPTPIPAPTPDAAFPGIFEGANAGDFGGLPPAPGEVTGRVPEVAIRLSGMADQLGEALESRNPSLAAWLVYDVRTKLNAAADAVAVAAEAGDFGGLPPATVAARVPELAARLRKVADLYDSFLAANHAGMGTEDYCRLASGGTTLKAIIDELAAEAGDQ